MSAEAEGRATAESFRARNRLGNQPLGDLVALIEQIARVDVAVLDAGPDEHGLTMRDPRRGTVFIGVARTTRPMRQRSTLAHELGHVLFADWGEGIAGDWSHRSPAEKRADAFARHLLVPAAGLLDFLDPAGRADLVTLSAVVQRFVVSPALAAIALEQAGFINATTKAEWLTVTAPRLAARFGWADQYQALQTAANRRRAPQRLLARAIRGYAEGVLSAQSIATLRGITAEAAESELREYGISPDHPGVTWSSPTDLSVAGGDLSALDEDLEDHPPQATAAPEAP